MSEDLKKSAELLRRELGSIDLFDIEDLKKVELTDEEAMARAGDAELFYKNHFEKVLKLFIQKQLEFCGKEAENPGQFLFGRGTINGLCLLDEWFQEQIAKSLSRFEKIEEPEPGEPFNKV